MIPWDCLRCWQYLYSEETTLINQYHRYTSSPPGSCSSAYVSRDNSTRIQQTAPSSKSTLDYLDAAPPVNQHSSSSIDLDTLSLLHIGLQITQFLLRGMYFLRKVRFAIIVLQLFALATSMPCDICNRTVLKCFTIKNDRWKSNNPLTNVLCKAQLIVLFVIGLLVIILEKPITNRT